MGFQEAAPGYSVLQAFADAFYSATPGAPFSGNPADIVWATTDTSVSDTQWEHEDEVVAVFSHFTVALSDKLSAIASFRYSEEEKTLDRTNLLFDNPTDYRNYLVQNHAGAITLGVNVNGPDLEGEKVSEEEWTYNFALQYFLNEDTQLFGSFSHGFKAGGMDLLPDTGGQAVNLFGFSPAVALNYNPEYVDSYELGLKTSYMDGRGRANIAVFRSEFDDIQFSVYTGLNFIIDNAGEAVSQGIEIENTYALTESITSNISLTFLDAEYGKGAPNGGEGEELSHAPEVAATIGLDYDKPINDQLALYGKFNYNYMGSHNMDYGSEITQDAYGVLSLQLGLRDAEGVWSATLWCDNCADEEYVTFVYNAPGYYDNTNNGYSGAPRTYGLTVSANF